MADYMADAEEWARVREILAKALELPLAERTRWLDEACAGDSDLRREVESLLEASDQTAFLDHPPMMPAAPGLEPGRRIAHYQIVAKIGEGGMGAVYQATDTTLDRPVALKVLTRGLGTAGHDRRFAREAKAASALNHPNIVTIYEFNSADGVDYLAMEYIQGVTLAQLLETRATPLETMLEYAAQAATAIARAHQAGIVHRDLKPRNIMVTHDGIVKVLDFGVAKRQSQISEQDVTQTALTMAGAVVGTPAYMSPEQARGENEDWRTDIFSFGVILYEIAAGHRPFHGKNAHAVLFQIVHEEPPPLQTTPQLARLIASCLKKDRAERIQSMDEVAAALKPGKPAQSRRAWLAGLGAAVAAIGGALWVFHPTAPAIAYTLEVQLSTGEVYAASTADTFEGGSKFRLRIRPSKSGFFYLINEGPGDSGTNRYYVLHQAPIRAGEEITTGWYVFDQNPGVEKLWLASSAAAAPSIEPGEVKPDQSLAVREFLANTHADSIELRHR